MFFLFEKNVDKSQQLWQNRYKFMSVEIFRFQKMFVLSLFLGIHIIIIVKGQIFCNVFL